MVGELTVIFKFELTITVATAVLDDPLFVAVTVYDVVEFGETVIASVVSPVFHKYVDPGFAPETVNVAEPPGQIVAEFTLIDVDEFTVTVATAVPVQPFEVPVTVYDVVEVGLTEIGFVVSPVFHE
jgi:hypothetical protein